MKIINRSGPRIEPCGTPDLRSSLVENFQPNLKIKYVKNHNGS